MLCTEGKLLQPLRSAFMHVLHFMYTLCELPYICSVNCIHVCLEWSADYIFLEILILMFFFYNYYLWTACGHMCTPFFTIVNCINLFFFMYEFVVRLPNFFCLMLFLNMFCM